MFFYHIRKYDGVKRPSPSGRAQVKIKGDARAEIAKLFNLLVLGTNYPSKYCGTGYRIWHVRFILNDDLEALRIAGIKE